MNKYIIIFKKEIKELFRDRFSLFILLIPILIFPIFNIGNNYLNQNNVDDTQIYIETHSLSTTEILQSFLNQNPQYHINHTTAKDPLSLLTNGDIDCLVKTHNNGIDFIYNSASYSSLSATTKLGENFQAFYQNHLVENNIHILHFTLKDESNVLANTSSSIVNIVIPIIMVMLIFQGTSSFANDLFSGERERRTLELLLLSGIKKSHIYWGKVLCLLSISTLNLITGTISCFLSLEITSTGIRQLKFAQIGGTATNILIIASILFTLSVMAVFLSAAVSIISKSMKRAQLINELVLAIPVGFIVMLTLGFIPGNAQIYSFIPLLNLVYHLNAVFRGNIHLGNIIMSLSLSIVFSFLIIIYSIKQLKSEKIVL